MNHEVGIVGGSRKQSSSSSTDDESSTRPPSSAQTYLRARAYSIVYGLHKSFTTSILQQKSLKPIYEQEPIPLSMASINLLRPRYCSKNLSNLSTSKSLFHCLWPP